MTDEAIIIRVREGKSAKISLKIAEELGVSLYAAHKAIKDAGGALWLRKGSTSSRFPVEEAISYRRAGLGWDDIATVLGHPKPNGMVTLIRYHCRKRGITWPIIPEEA